MRFMPLSFHSRQVSSLEAAKKGKATNALTLPSGKVTGFTGLSYSRRSPHCFKYKAIELGVIKFLLPKQVDLNL